MATDPFEMAVIDAAISWAREERNELLPEDRLNDAVAALLEHRKQLGEVTEVEWCTVAIGDSVRAKTGTMWEVKSSLRMQDGTYSLTLVHGEKTSTVSRPSKDAPKAWVRRGADGRAVDSFVHVFASGGAG